MRKLAAIIPDFCRQAAVDSRRLKLEGPTGPCQGVEDDVPGVKCRQFFQGGKRCQLFIQQHLQQRLVFFFGNAQQILYAFGGKQFFEFADAALII